MAALVDLRRVVALSCKPLASALVVVLVSLTGVSLSFAQLFPNTRPPRTPSPTSSPQPGQVGFQAAGIGLFYGGALGFAVGSHIDRRLNVSGRSPDDAAVALLLAGALTGGLGGFVWGTNVTVEPGRLALAASSVLWGGVLTFGVRGAIGRGDDVRARLLAGTMLAVVSWHLWDDIKLSRAMSWFIDAGGTLGVFIAGTAAASFGQPGFDNLGNVTSQGDQEEAERQQFLVFTGVLSGILAATTALAWAINDPTTTSRQRRRFDISLTPLAPTNGSLPGVGLVGRF